MHIHKIKPVHGWREFFGEVGIIVLGVLIALGAEQLIETIHWRHKVEAAREVLSVDFADKLWVAREREFASYCLGRRLDMLAGIFTQATKTHRLPAIAAFNGPPNRRWNVDSWDSFVADGTTNHFPLGTVYDWGRIAHAGQTLSEYNHEELKLWDSLRAVAGPGRPVDDAELAHLIETLQIAGSQSARIRRIARFMRHAIQDSEADGLDVDRKYRTWLVPYQGKPDHGRARRDCSSGDPAETVDRYGYPPRLRAALERPLDRNSNVTSAFSF